MQTTGPAGPDNPGIIFDGGGEAWAIPSLERAGYDAHGNLPIIHHAVAEYGCVYIAKIRDSLMAIFDPSSVTPLAAFAAFYEVLAQAPKSLILANPGKPGYPDRYEVFYNVIDGFRRLEDTARRARQPPHPQLMLPAPPGKERAPERRADGPRKRKPARAGCRPRPDMKARGPDSSVKLPLPLASISAGDEWLGRLLECWGSARRGRRLPSSESLDSLELLNIARGRAHIVDTRGSNPAGYRFRLWGAVNSYGDGYSNRTLGEMPAGLMRDEAIVDYRQAVATGIPLYHLISHVERSLSYSYARLLLPLAQDGRRVDRLIVLINERHLPELARR